MFLLTITVCMLTSTNAFVTPSIPAIIQQQNVNAIIATYKDTDTRRYFDLGSMISNFGKKVTLSHILIGPPESKTGRGMTKEDATAKLLELKEQIGNDEAKFAEAAREFSSCKSTKDGGDLGEFGPGVLWKSIDEIGFQKEVGVVHGPVSSPYGEHLVLVRERTGDK